MRKLIGALKLWVSRRVGIEAVVEINWFKSASDVLYACPGVNCIGKFKSAATGLFSDHSYLSLPS